MSAPDTPEATLRMLRIIWAAALLGLIVFGGLVMTLAGSSPADAPLKIDADKVQLGLLIGMVAVVALGHFVRMQVYKRHWQDFAISPSGYFTGNIILFALLEAFVFLVLVLMLLSQQVAALALPGAVVLALFAVNFPTGSAMQSERRIS